MHTLILFTFSQYPAVALLFERCVITASFPVAAMMHTLGLATMVRAACYFSTI